MLEPAPTKVVSISGTEMYYENGVLGRSDGPAVIHPGGDEEWWANGRRHRYDSSTPDILHPAVCNWGIMRFEYWIKGIFICRNPHEGEVIVEWDGWVTDGEDFTIHPMKFQIVTPEEKYKSIYPGRHSYKENKTRVLRGMADGCITRSHGDEECWT